MTNPFEDARSLVKEIEEERLEAEALRVHSVIYRANKAGETCAHMHYISPKVVGNNQN